MELSGALAVVTGATEGIGRAIAFQLGGAGAKLAICARTEANVRATVQELRDARIDAVGMACDVSDPAGVDTFAPFRHEAAGRAPGAREQCRNRPLQAAERAVARGLGRDVRNHNIRVVCPGSVATPFMDKQSRERPNRDRVLVADDGAHVVVSSLTLSDRAMVSELDIRPTNP
jgi:NADP-dependent 3-hydroxy acid dehydrogenase YdfG